MKNLKLRNNEKLSTLETAFINFQSMYLIPLNLKIPKRFITTVEKNPYHTNILFNKLLRDAFTDVHNRDNLISALKNVTGLDIVFDDELLDLDDYLASKLIQFYLMDAICNDYSVIKVPKEISLTFKKYSKEINEIYNKDDSAIQSLEEYSSDKLKCNDILILSAISADNVFVNIPLSITTDYLCSTAFIYALLIDLLEKESLI